MMTGSDKQITWAESIKANAMRILATNKAGDVKKEWPAYDAITSQLESITEAKWWIDHRDALPTNLLPENFARMMRKDVVAAKLAAMETDEYIPS